VDQNAIEELFERNADMRLLEFRHNEPGRGAPPKKRTSGSTFSAESIVSSIPDAVTEKAPRLRVTIAAAPATGVIPGAVVGVAIDVFNDGNAPAPESKLLVSIPLETQFRAGSLRIDGRETQAPEQLFSSGLPIARLPGATFSKVTFQLAVLAGVNSLYLQPRLQTNGVPVVGTAGISIKRGVSAGPMEAPRPFYELDEEEHAEVAAESAEPIMPPVLDRAEAPVTPTQLPLPPELPLTPIAPAVPEPAAVAGEPEPVVVVAAAIVAEPEPEPVPVPRLAPVEKPAVPRPAKKPPLPKALPKAPLGAAVVADERMIRYRTLGNNDIALLERLFTADVPGVIAHYVMISSIACTEPGSGEDTSGYAPFLRRDIELLGRALVHSRMGKPPQYRIAQNDLDALALGWNLTPQQAFPPQRRLRRDLRKPEWAAIGGLTQPSERDATLRTRIALLALAGETLDGVERRAADDCAAALGAYRSSVLAWLVPLCVASAGQETFVIPAPPASVDAAGRRLVGVLKAAVVA
jgi:hypothetical protein